MKNKSSLFTIILVVLVNIIVANIYFRLDITKDKRFTVSNIAKNQIDKIDQNINIQIFLTGNLPSDFKKLEQEVSYIMKEFKSVNSFIHYRFINPNGKEQQLNKLGLTPSNLTVQDDGVVSERYIFPWAIIKQGSKIEKVSLLKSNYFETQENQIQNSIQNLEFAFTNAIHKITTSKKKKIAILKGNQETSDIFQYDWLKTIKESYYLAPFTLDSTENAPVKTLEQLQKYDLAIISNPKTAFTEKEKFILDQFTINGGKSIWLLDMATVSKDTLLRKGETLAYQKDLNLTDYLFNYGVRFKKHLLKDLYSAKIKIATGKIGNNTQYDNFLWYYYPLLKNKNNHPINTNMGPIKLEYANTLDTLNPKINKTVLLESSLLTQTKKLPDFIQLKEIGEKPEMKNYQNGKKILGVLLEGDFQSAYRNRIKPIKNNHFISKGKDNQMIVIADGDISINQIHRGQPLELGLDKWTNSFYANKEFLMNAVNYLMDDKGLLQLRSKKVDIPILNKQKIISEKQKWQVVNILIPLILLGITMLSYLYFKRKRLTQ